MELEATVACAAGITSALIEKHSWKTSKLREDLKEVIVEISLDEKNVYNVFKLYCGGNDVAGVLFAHLQGDTDE